MKFDEEWFNDFQNRDHSSKVGKKHHRLPRFYMERWVNSRGMIQVIDRESGEFRLSKPINSLLEKDYYSFVTKSGDISGALEDLLTEIEGSASEDLAALLTSPFREFPVPERYRESLILFATFQAARGHRNRRTNEFLTDFITRMEFSSIDSENVEAFLRARAIEPTLEAIEACLKFVGELDEIEFVPHTNSALQNMMNLLPKLFEAIQSRPMLVVNYGAPSIATCDEPLILISYRERSLTGLGFLDADEIWLPLSPSHLLVFGRINTSPTDQIWRDRALDPAEVNGRISWNSHQFIVTLPDSNFRGLEQVPGPQPIMQISGGIQEWTSQIGQKRLAERSPRARFRAPSEWV